MSYAIMFIDLRMQTIVLFDTHLHFDPEDNIPEILAAARLAGVTRCLVAGTDLTDSRKGQALTVIHAGVLAAAGVHPHQAAEFAGDLGAFRELARLPGIVAIGEIGLDYHYDFSPRETQRRVFGAFLGLAAELKLPALIHCREAFADTFAMLQEAAQAGVQFELHSFTGTPAEAELLLPLGAYFGFNGMVTFTKANNIRETLRVIPRDRLLIETDSPYLAPVPHRGKRNQPGYLPLVVKRMALELSLSQEEVARLTTANALCFFSCTVPT